ncbi:hypothetical protein MSAN_00063100 [Mycena sanguinolenta]|uniref:Uncharacterized protein n=1 Tax=Mycena sanguinolenta TaxID=230812 RepID=A0A8H6ZFL6_9AGAR|nr:hypothetical protein MSAN_00063100 [Mycena sanguinolenta]
MASPAQRSFVSVAAGDSLKDVVPIVIQFVFGLVAQTFVFGAYTLLICLSTRMLRKRGLKAWDNRAMLMIILFMYLLAAGYWASTIAFTADLLRAHVNVTAVFITGRDEIIQWLPLFNAIALINFIISDGVVIWKARAICQHQLKKYLWISMGFLVLAAIAVVLTISFIMVLENRPESVSLDPRLVQAFVLGLSLLSTLSATALLVVTARRNQPISSMDFGKDTKSGQVLTMATTVGLIYSLLTLLALISAFISLPHGGVLAEIYYPISFYIASAYPPIMVLLIETSCSLTETSFSDSASGQPSSNCPTQFRSRNASQTLCQIDSIIGPDIIHPLAKTVSASSISTPNHSRFSDNSLDSRRIV